MNRFSRRWLFRGRFAAPRVMIFAFALGLLPLAREAFGAEAMTFRLASSGKCAASCSKVIAAEGEIADRTPQDFVDFLRGNPLGGAADAIIFINSPGGKVVAAMELGKLFRREGVAAAVGRAEFGSTAAQFASLAETAFQLAFMRSWARERASSRAGAELASTACSPTSRAAISPKPTPRLAVGWTTASWRERSNATAQ